MLCACGCGTERADDARGRFVRGHMFYALRKPLNERLWAKTMQTPDCWLWPGRLDRCGYGTLGDGKKGNMLAHRAAWIVTHGPIPDGMKVCHKCDNPRCVRPDHLFLGTQHDNIMDCRAKGRDRWSRAAAGAY